MGDIERNIEKLKAKQSHYNDLLKNGYRTSNGVPFGSVSVDKDNVRRELDNINRNLQRLTPPKLTGLQENKERDFLRKEGEYLREKMLSKDELMGEKTGRADGHDIREEREEDVRKQMKFDREDGKRKSEYDKRVEKFNFNVGADAIPKSEQIRRGGREHT